MELLQLLLPQLLQLLQITANYWLLLNEVMRLSCSQITANYCITATPQHLNVGVNCAKLRLITFF